MDLLLELIEQQKLEITQISLAQVTDQFLDYLRNNSDTIALKNLADFLVVTSKLILIKSRALLPLLELTPEEEEDIVDLEKQLKEYQRIRAAAQTLKKLLGQHNFCVSRQSKEAVSGFFYPPAKIKDNDLAMIFKRILDDVPVVPKLPQDILKSKISIEQRITAIADLIKKRIEIKFSALMDSNKDKKYLVANFLAILELTRRKFLIVKQEQMFGEIIVLKV